MAMILPYGKTPWGGATKIRGRAPFEAVGSVVAVGGVVTGVGRCGMTTVAASEAACLE